MLNKIQKLRAIILKILREENEVLYISGSDKLPEVLKPDEEKELLTKLMTKNKQAKNTLVEKNLRLVVYIAKRFDNSGINIEDLISIGTIGLIKGVNSYKLDKNIKLATYASRCIENEILMYLRKNNKIRNEISIDEPINTDSEGNNLSLADLLGTDNDFIFKMVEDSDNEKVLKSAVTGLR